MLSGCKLFFGIKTVRLPVIRVFMDILVDLVVIGLAANNVVVETSLPYGNTAVLSVNLF